MRYAILLAAVAAVGTLAAREDREVKGGDQEFVTKASQSDMAEIATSTMAKSQATDKGVREFAAKMIEDHTKTSMELKALAEKKGYKVATTLDEKHRAEAAKLKKLEGAAFDRAYIAGQVKDHVEAVALFKKQSEGGGDADLKAWAKKTLPDLEHHLEMAKKMQGKTGSGTDKTGSDKSGSGTDK